MDVLAERTNLGRCFEVQSQLNSFLSFCGEVGEHRVNTPTSRDTGGNNSDDDLGRL
jgi:hypothetical protein